MIKISSIESNSNSMNVTWESGQKSEFNYLWLRDNCPTAFHPKTKERNFNLMSVSENIKPKSYEFNEENLEIIWSESDYISKYQIQWLFDNQYKKGVEHFLMMPEVIVWQHDILLKKFNYNDIVANNNSFYNWMSYLASYGLSIVNEMPDSETSMEDIAEKIGHLRQTNFGLTFNVRSKPNPNNQAYTAEMLPLHTDLPNQETPPGYQFLHCLSNNSEGGESMFVDGFKVAEELKKLNPYYFELLSENKIPFRFHDDTCDIREMRSIISLVDREVNEITFNAHIADTFNLDPKIIQDYYLAYRAFIKILNDDQFIINFKLNGGEMVVFDNRRVLHGRKSFDPQTGSRHLRGCYVDRTEFKSKFRLLTNSLNFLK